MEILVCEKREGVCPCRKSVTVLKDTSYSRLWFLLLLHHPVAWQLGDIPYLHERKIVDFSEVLKGLGKECWGPDSALEIV